MTINPLLTISRTSVYGLARQDGKLLLIKQQKGPHAGRFDFPGGGIEHGETIEEALRREFREEVAMTFDSMHLEKNLTANTQGINEKGESYLLHQIGMIYSVTNPTLLQDQIPEMEFFWIDPTQLSEKDASPFVRQIINSKLYSGAFLIFK